MSSNRAKAIFYSCLLALQFGLQPLLTTNFTTRQVSRSSMVIGAEIGKIMIAIVTLAPTVSKDKLFSTWNLKESLYYAAIPAVLYAIQNVLVQVGYTLIDSMTFNLLNQTKTLSAAFWLWVMLGQPQSYMQIFALILLLAAALILNIGGFSKPTSLSADVGQYKLGVMVVVIASMLSGISAAFVQKAFVGPNPRNPLLYSAELAVYGIAFLVLKDLITGASGSSTPSIHIFAGWDWFTCIPVLTSAVGGLIVGLVTKYAGGVAKGFALIGGLLITALCQWLVENQSLGVEHWIAAVLVSLSIYLHSTYPVKKIKSA